MSILAQDRRLSRGASLLGEGETQLLIHSKEDVDPSHSALPPYTVLYILHFLRRQDIYRCKSVSKLWRTLASDACFGWVPAFGIPITPQRLTYYPMADYFKAISDASVQPVDISSVETNANATTVQFYDKGKLVATGYCIISRPLLNEVDSKVYQYSPPEKTGTYICDLFELCKTNPRMWRCELLEVPAHKGVLLQVPRWSNNLPPTHVFSMEVNIMELEKKVEAGGEVPWASMLACSATEESLRDINTFFSKISHSSPHIPMKTVTTQKQPLGLSKNLKLYKYQLDAVNWMKSVEEDVDIGFEYTELIPWRSAKTTVLFEPNGSRCIPVKNINAHIKRAFPKGGVLGDEMGLGKTTEIISLVLVNPGDPSLLDPANYRPPETTTDINKTNTPTTTASGRPARSVAQPHVLSHKTENINDLFVTNATLVLCPIHLLKQWHEEIEKHTSPHLNVVAFSNIRDVKGCTYGDIVNADMVIMPQELLLNDNYQSIGSSLGKDRTHCVDSYLSSLWKSGGALESRAPVMEHFNWRRVVVDEAHSIINNKFYQSTFLSLTANYWWFVSGTPFPNSATARSIVKFLRFPAHSNLHIEWGFMDIFMNNLYWRNTKESVKNEYEIPPIVEDLVLLDLTNIEKSIHKDSVINLLPEDQYRAITHFGLQYGFGQDITLTKTRVAMLDLLETRIKANKNQIVELNKNITENEKEIAILEKKVESDKVQLEKYEEKLHSSYSDFVQNDVWKLKNSIASNRDNSDRAKTRLGNCNTKLTDTKKKLKEDTELREELKVVAESSYNGPNMASEAVIQELELGEELVSSEDTKESKQEKKAKEEEKKEEEALPFSVIVDMTLPQLKDELAKRGIKTTYKQRKADLQKLLKDTVKNNVKPTEEPQEEKEEENNKRKQTNTKAKPAKKQKIGKNSSATASDEAPKRTTADKVKEQNVLKWLVEKEGTKLGNLLFYLKRLWADNPTAKLILFSRFQPTLDKISDMLSEHNVNHTSLDGNLQNRTKQMRTFKKDDIIRVLLLHIAKLSAGTNIIEATHIVFIEPSKGTKNEARSLEEQAIGRAYRQGQTTQVTVVRFVVRDTIEYSTYIQNYGNLGEKKEEVQSTTHSGHAKIQRTGSITTTLATTPALQTPTKMVQLMEGNQDLQ